MKVQAESLQLSTIIKEKGENTTDKIPQGVQSRMEELEKENTDLRKCIDELKEQIQIIRQMYSNNDYEDGKKEDGNRNKCVKGK